MSEGVTIASMMERVRRGDQEAAAELVRRYEPLIRREVRFRLQDRRLRRVLDSMDVCQSVLGSFFVRAATGQYDVNRADQLLRLLVTIAKNKVASAARKQARQRRDGRRETPEGALALDAVADPGPGPGSVAAADDLLRAFRLRLDAEERQLAELRGAGLAWNEVAERLGGTAQARRMQLARAIARVSRQLGLDDEDEEAIADE